MQLKTENFKIPSKKVLILLSIYHGKYFFIISLIGILFSFFIGIGYDARWFVVLLMWICIVIPLMIVFLFFYHGLLPTNSVNTTLHNLLFTDDELLITVIKATEEEQTDLYVKTIPYCEIRRISIETDSLLLFIQSDSPNKGIIFAPLDCFKNKEDITEIISRVSKKIKTSDIPILLNE